MKALIYFKAHSLSDFSLQLADVTMPVALGHDVVVKVKAISVNPVDYKIRSSRSGGTEGVILGWDAAGVVTELGPEVTGLQVGDEVYYAGDITRPGSYAEFQAVDSRIVARKPRTLSFAKAACIPLTALTAWEALLQKRLVEGPKAQVLVIGGAGGVGSMAIQLLKAKTDARVIATASRSETLKWCRDLGADSVIDHHKGLSQELARLGIKHLDTIFSTTHTDRYLDIIPELLKPFGHLVLIDDPQNLDIVPFKRKALSVHWELMFSKTLYGYELESQGEILKQVAELIDQGKMKTTLVKHLKGLTPENMKVAHEALEAGTSIGKIAIEF